MSLNYFEAEHHIVTYSKFRPIPPKRLIEHTIRFVNEQIAEPLELAVDVGCGSGQSTEILAPYFKTIIGFDSNERIIKEGRKKCSHLNIFYETCQGEKMDLEDESVDLITVSQALHWFDLQKFYKEANRVMKKNGVLAVYGYNLPVILCNGSPQIENLVEKYYTDVMADFTLPQSRKVYIEKYTAKEFNEINFIEGGRMKRVEEFLHEIEGTVNDLAGYMSSWSAYQNYTKQMGEENGKKLLCQFKDEFKELVKNNVSSDTFTIRFNYFLLLGRKN